MPHNPIDAHVGNRVRTRRTLLGLNQTQLGDALGYTFQQVQKYEKGMNRISASKLYQMSKTLDVPISYFFEDIGGTALEIDGARSAPADIERDQLHKRETLELVRAYYRIDDPEVRRHVDQLIKALGKSAS